MQEPRAREWEQFFLAGWRRTLYGILAGTFGLGAVQNLWRDGRFENMHVIMAVLQLTAAVIYGWHVWRGYRVPVLAVSPEKIEWGSPQGRKRQSIPLHDVLGLTPQVGKALTPLGLQTRSHGTIWVSVAELSAHDRYKVRTVIERRLTSTQGPS
jgi:hypothetical protein